MSVIQIFVPIGFGLSFIFMVVSFAYIRYKTTICKNAISLYLGEHEHNLSNEVIKRNKARVYLESQVSRTVGIMMLLFGLMQVPSKI